MSGGSMDYAYGRVEEAADRFVLSSPERVAFRAHLLLVARAMKAIEWVDSCDTGEGSEVAAIMACISRADVVAAAVERAEVALADLQRAIDGAKGQ